MRSGMCDQKRNPQEVTLLNLFEKGAQGFPEKGPVRGGEIDEIAVMGADDTHLGFLLCLPESLDFCGEDSSGPPLVSGPGEDLHDFAGAFFAVVGGVVQPASYGNVGTEHGLFFALEGVPSGQSVRQMAVKLPEPLRRTWRIRMIQGGSQRRAKAFTPRPCRESCD